MLIRRVFLYIIGTDGEVRGEGQRTVCLYSGNFNEAIGRDHAAISRSQVFGGIQGEIDVEDFIPGADFKQLVFLKILKKSHQYLLALIVNRDRGAGHRYLLARIGKLHRDRFLIDDHSMRRFGFHDLKFSKI